MQSPLQDPTAYKDLKKMPHACRGRRTKIFAKNYIEITVLFRGTRGQKVLRNLWIRNSHSQFHIS